MNHASQVSKFLFICGAIVLGGAFFLNLFFNEVFYSMYEVFFIGTIIRMVMSLFDPALGAGCLIAGIAINIWSGQQQDPYQQTQYGAQAGQSAQGAYAAQQPTPPYEAPASPYADQPGYAAQPGYAPAQAGYGAQDPNAAQAPATQVFIADAPGTQVPTQQVPNTQAPDTQAPPAQERQFSV